MPPKTTATATATASAPSVGLLARWERLTERERLSVGALVVAFVVFLMILAGIYASAQLAEIEDDNAAIRQALKDVDANRDHYLRMRSKASASESRISSGGARLEGLLEEAAKPDLKLDEITERSGSNSNKKYVERSVDVRIRRTNLLQLAQFLKRVETGPTLVVVQALKILTRDDKHEEIEVELTASTWERKAAAKEKDKDKDKDREGAAAKERE